MKNQIIKRKMGDFDVFQRTEDGMFNATELMRQWNSANNANKSISNFMKKDSTKEYINAIMEELSPKNSNSQLTDYQHLSKQLKGDNQPVTLFREFKGRTSKNGRTPDQVWMHPLLFMEFAGYFSPRFRVKVNQFVLDHLIEYRNRIGDRWSAFTAAAAKIGCRTQDDFKVIARCLNCAVLGAERQKDQRNSLTAAEATELDDVQEKFIFLVQNGYVNNMTDAKAFFRKRWEEKFLKDIPFTDCKVMD